MRQNGGVPIQDPSASPTYALSEAANNPSVPASLRRNLFASHLSRRAVPTTQYALPTFVDETTDPFLGSTTASSSRRYHNQERIMQSHSLAQSVHQDEYTMSANSHHGYMVESRRSSSRSTSPVKPHYVSSASSIVLMDPLTGRPQLPILPTLPARFRANESNEDDDTEDGDLEDDGDPDMDYDHSQGAPFRRTRTFERGVMTQNELELHSSSLLGGAAPRLHDLIDTYGAATADDTDYEKIESILSEMQKQQKDRARTAIPPELTPSLMIDTPTDSRISARTRGKSRAATRSATAEQVSRNGNTSPKKPRVGGVGATLKQTDKDELLSLIMSSLSKRVQELDDDAWMFGAESHPGVGGFVAAGSFTYTGDGAAAGN